MSDDAPSEPRTLAQRLCLLGGLLLVLVGLVGFLVNGSFATGAKLMGSKLIVFEVNGWHDLVHLLSGLFLLAGAGHRRRAKRVAFLFGVVYAVVAVWGLADSTILDIIHVDGADEALHIVLAVAAIVIGLTSRGRYDRERALGTRLRAGHALAR